MKKDIAFRALSKPSNNGSGPGRKKNTLQEKWYTVKIHLVYASALE